jgi:large subunit ribosomal protein L33
MPAGKKPFTKLQCSVCKRINYFTNKSKKASEKGEKKLELKKYCKWCRKHTAHKEGKK